jgi:hypothetical protein
MKKRAVAVVEGGEYIHAKTGNRYKVINVALNEADLAEVVVYQDVLGGPVWVRPRDNFCDGRFIPA